MKFFEGKKKNWMIVLHRHHCGSKGFKHETLIGATKNEAKGYAALKAEEWRGSEIYEVTGMAIELPDVVQVVPQKDMKDILEIND